MIRFLEIGISAFYDDLGLILQRIMTNFAINSPQREKNWT